LSNNLKRVIFKSGFVQVVNALRIDHFYQWALHFALNL
jgi:hypothetical protein